MKRFLAANIPFLILVILLNIVVYANSLKGGFVSDDIASVLNNPQVQDISKSLSGSHRHIQYLLWGILINIFGVTPVPMHALSILLHIVNAILLFTIVYKAIDKRAAIIASLLFSVHPVTTETVSWVSATIYLLLALALFSTTLAYTLYRQTKYEGYLYLTYGLFTATIIFTDNYWNYIIVPFLVIYDQFILEKKYTTKGLYKLLPLIIATCALLAVNYSSTIKDRAKYVDTGQNTAFFKRLPYTVYMHAELLIFAKNLTLYHEGETITQQKYQLMRVATVVLAIVVPIVIVKNRKTGGLILLSYAAILPALSPVQIAWFIAERYLYIPAAMFCTVVALVILKIGDKVRFKYFIFLITVTLITIYSVRTIYRNIDWQTPKQLWLATEKIGPNSPRVHNNLGDIYANEKDFDKSIWHFKKAIELQPRYADAMHNLGNTYLQMGDIESAEMYLLESLIINPQLYQATYKLGVIAANKGAFAEALGYFDQTLSIKPNDQYTLAAIELVKNKMAEK